MMQKIKEFVNSNFKHFLVSIIGSLIVILLYYIIDNGLKFSNSIEYKDIFTLIVNIIFVMFISRSIAKNYDSQRKKKDLLIDEVKFVHGICIEQFQALKISNYDITTYLPRITKVRDELENIKQIIIFSDIKIDCNPIFTQINQQVRQIDRTINSPHQSNPLSDFDISMIDHYVRGIRKQLFQIIYLINNS